MDILSGGRLNPGVSVGEPRTTTTSSRRCTRTPRDKEDFSYGGCADCWPRAGERVTDVSGIEGFEVFSDRVQPHSPGLASGSGTAAAACLGAVGRRARMNFLTANVVQAEGPTELRRDPEVTHPDVPRATPRRWAGAGTRAWWSSPPTAPTRSSGQVLGVRRGPQAAHRGPGGPGAAAVRPDLLGTSAEIAQMLYATPASGNHEVVFALPFTFEHADYVQILTDMAQRLGPALGWQARG